ncbi:40320_t:CDS:2 [Gigaspora margarita]|uniref:40320_t:CDS:1 n=1 Tax=Gigaspora margarita TaxID=4874 RepID=A0ABN7UDV0_GIGMA|nr:40320_t:CDS:2 [Gigaspora margarita]
MDNISDIEELKTEEKSIEEILEIACFTSRFHIKAISYYNKRLYRKTGFQDAIEVAEIESASNAEKTSVVQNNNKVIYH